MFLSPANAHKSCLKKADWIEKCKGGESFLRELTDLLIFASGFNPYIPLEQRKK